MIVFAIDPGPHQSAYVQWNSRESEAGGKIHEVDIIQNSELIRLLNENIAADVFAIEMVACYGMAVGRDVFETCVWIGRFTEHCQRDPLMVYRRDVKMHHCGSMKAKDTNIRQALIDKYGAPGTKKAPGLTYGLKSHLWSAFAIATFISETNRQ